MIKFASESFIWRVAGWSACDLSPIETVQLLRYFHVVKNTHYGIHLKISTTLDGAKPLLVSVLIVRIEKQFKVRPTNTLKMFNLIYKC